MNDHDPLFEQLAALDPTRSDPAPEPGSSRHTEIMESAMQSQPTAHLLPEDKSPLPSQETADPTATTRRHPGSGDRSNAGDGRGRRHAVLVGAAAAILAVIAAVLVFQPEESLSPAAALSQAAENTGDALTLRSEYIQDDGSGGYNVVRTDHRGGDYRRKNSKIGPDGNERLDEEAAEDEDFVVYIGNKGWTTADGSSEPVVVDPEQVNAPYAESSAAIVKASMTESTVSEVGDEAVRGVETTHYRIKLDSDAKDRLAKLPANQLSGFELESPHQIRSLDVWVGDGYLRRIRVTQTWQDPDSKGTTVEFYDFGADITITPPS